VQAAEATQERRRRVSGRGRGSPKEKQEREYIFVGMDSDGKQQSLAKSTESDEEVSEADFNESGSEPSQPQNEGSDGHQNSGRRGGGVPAEEQPILVGFNDVAPVYRNGTVQWQRKWMNRVSR
jgi:hypothetical protein